MLKRIFDVVVSILGLIVLSPIVLIITILIQIDSKGPVLFIQERVGKDNTTFNIYKFRTMKHETLPKQEQLTLGNKDYRITKIGLLLRQYKMDEIPQLWNVLIGNMSLVGPRPELRYFVNFYKEEDYDVFSVRPGITSLASLKYIHEAELFKDLHNPEEYYIKNIIPHKISMDKAYIKNKNLLLDIKIILKTIYKIFIR